MTLKFKGAFLQLSIELNIENITLQIYDYVVYYLFIYLTSQQL